MFPSKLINVIFTRLLQLMIIEASVIMWEIKDIKLKHRH